MSAEPKPTALQPEDAEIVASFASIVSEFGNVQDFSDLHMIPIILRELDASLVTAGAALAAEQARADAAEAKLARVDRWRDDWIASDTDRYMEQEFLAAWRGEATP